MQCIKCGHKNPGTVLYCGKCGLKMDMTADEVSHFYEQKVRSEKRESMHKNAFRILVLSIILFIVSITMMVMAGGEPPMTSYLPSATRNTEFLKFEYQVAPKLEPMLIPVDR